MATTSEFLPEFSADVEEFKRYIDYQTRILKELQINRGWYRRSEGDNTPLMDEILTRTHKSFEALQQQVPNDISFIEHYLTFCEEHMLNTTGCQVVESVIEQYQKTPEVWKLAVKWYMHKDTARAELILNKGLTANPESNIMYTAAIELKVFQVIAFSLPNADNSSIIKKLCDEIKVYGTLILKNYHSSQQLINIVLTLQKHIRTIQTQEIIVEYLFRNHAHESIVWILLAYRERGGLHFKTDANEEPRAGITKSYKTRTINCINKLKQGLTIVPEDQKRSLWFNYAETVIDMSQEQHRPATATRKRFLEEALMEGFETGYLDKVYYEAWAEVLPDDKRLNILAEATLIYPESEELWTLRLKYATKTKDMNKVNVIFKLGVMALEERALPLWEMIIDYHRVRSDNEVMKSIFEDGIKQPEQIATVLRPRYSAWQIFVDCQEAMRKIQDNR